jgi:hypothetical protein
LVAIVAEVDELEQIEKQCGKYYESQQSSVREQQTGSRQDVLDGLDLAIEDVKSVDHRAA